MIMTDVEKYLSSNPIRYFRFYYYILYMYICVQFFDLNTLINRKVDNKK